MAVRRTPPPPPTTSPPSGPPAALFGGVLPAGVSLAVPPNLVPPPPLAAPPSLVTPPPSLVTPPPSPSSQTSTPIPTPSPASPAQSEDSLSGSQGGLVVASSPDSETSSLRSEDPAPVVDVVDGQAPATTEQTAAATAPPPQLQADATRSAAGRNRPVSLMDHSAAFGASLNFKTTGLVQDQPQIIIRVWEMIPDPSQGGRLRRIFKTFVWKESMKTEQVLANASRKLALEANVALTLFELIPSGRPRKMEADELPYDLLTKGKKLVFCKGENDFVPIEVTSGDLKTAYEPALAARVSPAASSSSSSSSKSGHKQRGHKKDKRKKGGNTELHISMPVGLVHKTHVDKNFTWTSEIGGNVSDQFEKQTKLGEGAYGAVYKAFHVESKFVLALKVIKMSTSKSKQEEILHEIDVLKKCSNPNIVQYYGCFFLPDALHILMDFCEMGSILDTMKTVKEALTEAEVSAVIWGSVRGLQYLHSQNIVHLDMKSANVLMTNMGQIKLADFGVSEQLTDHESHTTGAHGTPYFMAPEVLEGKQYSFAADIWSLGITAIEMAEQIPPYFQDSPIKAIYKICSEPNPPTFKDSAKFSEVFLDFVTAKCIQREPGQRLSALDLLSHEFIAKHQETEGESSKRSLWGLVDKVIIARGGTPPARSEPPSPSTPSTGQTSPRSRDKRKNRLSGLYTLGRQSAPAELFALIEQLSTENTQLKEKVKEQELLIQKLKAQLQQQHS